MRFRSPSNTLMLTVCAAAAASALAQASGQAAAPPEQYAWDSLDIEVATLKAIGRAENAAGVAQNLRELGVKVLVIDRRDGSRPAIGLENLREDEAAADFYADPKQDISMVARYPRIQAQFIAPYDFIITHFPTRPLIERSLVLAASSTTRDVLIHEAVHYLLYKKRALPNQRCGKHPCTPHAAHVYAYFHGDPAEKASHELGVNEYLGEELAVNRILLTHRVALRLTDEDAFRAKSNFVAKYQQFAERLITLETRNPSLTPKIENHQARLRAMKVWYNTVGHAL